MAFNMYWLDAAALNEPAQVTFDCVSMTVQYFATQTYSHAPSPRWPFTFDQESMIISIPKFRYKQVGADGWVHNMKASWCGFYFRCYPPYSRIMIIPVGNIIVDAGPNLSQLLPAPPPPPPKASPMMPPPTRSAPRYEPYPSASNLLPSAGDEEVTDPDGDNTEQHQFM
jgi:hypothetical protein